LLRDASQERFLAAARPARVLTSSIIVLLDQPKLPDVDHFDVGPRGEMAMIATTPLLESVRALGPNISKDAKLIESSGVFRMRSSRP
jgi:hypothetical protein